jgi:hypothetical protein
LNTDCRNCNKFIESNVERTGEAKLACGSVTILGISLRIAKTYRSVPGHLRARRGRQWVSGSVCGLGGSCKRERMANGNDRVQCGERDDGRKEERGDEK